MYSVKDLPITLAFILVCEERESEGIILLKCADSCKRSRERGTPTAEASTKRLAYYHFLYARFCCEVDIYLKMQIMYKDGKRKRLQLNDCASLFALSSTAGWVSGDRSEEQNFHFLF